MEDKIAIAYSITLYNILDKILYVNGSEGVEAPVERELAFNVKYKLQRNLDVLLKDYAYYQNERTELIKKYGKEEEGNTGRITVTEENMEKFKEELLKSVNVEVSHTFKKLTPEEVNSIKGDININSNEMNIFIAFMVEDAELVDDLKQPVEPKKEEADETAKKTKKGSK